MNKKRAKEIVDQFKGKQVLVIGDVMIDHYVYGNVERLNPEAPVPILEARDEEERTGGAGNVAKNTAMLDAKTTLVSIVGDDIAADRLAELAKAEKYQQVCIRDASRPTTRKIRYIVGSQQMLRVDFERTKDVSKQVELEVITAVEDEVKKGVDVIIVSDYAKGVITERVAKTIMSLAKKHKIPVTADIKPSRAPYFVGVTCIAPNVKEAHEMLGLNQHEQGGKKPKELARALRDEMKCDVYLTLGAGGVYVLSGDVELHAPQNHVVEVFDVSGAGDTSAAVIALARACGATHEETAQLANAAGAVVVGKVGSVGLTQKELIEMITNNKMSSRTDTT